jgi:hypothetical protein
LKWIAKTAFSYAAEGAVATSMKSSKSIFLYKCLVFYLPVAKGTTGYKGGHLEMLKKCMKKDKLFIVPGVKNRLLRACVAAPPNFCRQSEILTF